MMELHPANPLSLNNSGGKVFHSHASAWCWPNSGDPVQLGVDCGLVETLLLGVCYLWAANLEVDVGSDPDTRFIALRPFYG